MIYGTSILICEKVRKHKKHDTLTWIESLFMCFVGVFGMNLVSTIMINCRRYNHCFHSHGLPCLLSNTRFSCSRTSSFVVCFGRHFCSHRLTIFWMPFGLGMKFFQYRIVHVCAYHLSGGVLISSSAVSFAVCFA